MASELRHETLFDTGADGVLVVSAGAEFRNDSSQMIHIREIEYNHGLATAGPNEGGSVELSKSPVFAGNTNNNVFFTMGQQLRLPTDVALDSGMGVNGKSKYGRGQVTLEPNESLFINMDKTSGGVLNARYNIRYHF